VRRLEHDGDVTWGTMHVGNYGFAADGVNIATLREAYRRTPEDAELLPFYFYLELPSDRSVGFLIVQRHGVHGPYEPLRRALVERFRQAVPDVDLQFGRLVPTSVVNRVTHGKLISIRVTTYHVPREITDRFHLAANTTETADYVVTFKAKRGQSLSLPGWAARRRRQAALTELPSEFDPTRTRVDLGYTYAGRTRTVNIADLEAMAPYFDITGQVEMSSNGHPLFDSVHEIATSHAEELRDKLGIT
jgi:hypothetical protein